MLCYVHNSYSTDDGHYLGINPEGLVVEAIKDKVLC